MGGVSMYLFFNSLRYRRKRLVDFGQRQLVAATIIIKSGDVHGYDVYQRQRINA